MISNNRTIKIKLASPISKTNKSYNNRK